MHIRSKDTVVVITGKDKGKEGKVLTAFPKTGKVLVEGVAIATKHQKPRQQGVPGGIVKVEGAMYACKVQLYCPKCDKGIRPSVTYKVDKDGVKTKVRVCKCGYEFE